MSHESQNFYRGNPDSVPESVLSMSHDVMQKAEFEELERMQEEYLIEVSQLFPLDLADQKLKSFASEHIKHRFKKGDRQFCAVGKSNTSTGDLLWQLQEDYRLGNTNTCAERLLLDEADRTGQTLDIITTYRGENVENIQHPQDSKKRMLRTIQKRGGEEDEKGVMRHMVGPCAYCREGICRHNQTAMVIMPPGILRAGKTSMKLPAFMTYPENDLFQTDDPLEARLQSSGSRELLEARKKQKEFFREIAGRYPLTDADRGLLSQAYLDMGRIPTTNDPTMLIRARTIADQPVEVFGPVAPPLDKRHFSYLDYPRNPVEVRFINELLEQPHFPPSEKRRPGSSHSLHVFLELYREPGSDQVKLLLPNADTRQRMTERFIRSFILVNLDDKPVKLPFILFYPDRYKRLDKVGGRA